MAGEAAPSINSTSDYLTEQEREESDHYRDLKNSTDETVWSPRQMCNIPLPSPEWTTAEEEAIIMLFRHGLKFKKTWSLYLKHAMLNRTEAATSGKFYALKKREAELDNYHGVKHWTYDTPLSSSLERAIALLRGIRVKNLNTQMKVSTMDAEEYNRMRMKRMWGDVDDDAEGTVAMATKHPRGAEGVSTLEFSALFRARATGQAFVSASGTKY